MADESFSPETHRFAKPRYFEPVHAGDTLYPMLTITGLDPGPDDGRRGDARHHPQPGQGAGDGRTTPVSPAQETLRRTPWPTASTTFI